MEFLILIICTILKYIKYITSLAVGGSSNRTVQELKREFYYKMLDPIELKRHHYYKCYINRTPTFTVFAEPSELNTDQRKEENDI